MAVDSWRSVRAFDRLVTRLKAFDAKDALMVDKMLGPSMMGKKAEFVHPESGLCTGYRSTVSTALRPYDGLCNLPLDSKSRRINKGIAMSPMYRIGPALLTA